MTDGVYDGDSVVEKLSKLNSSQQSIEYTDSIIVVFLIGIIAALSRYCVSHRKKAKQIVEFWDKAFNNAQKEQRVSFLYLANDILQNSRRKGSEFVHEFWKVLPAALKYVYQNGNESGQTAAHRLVDIWEQRKVFGSRGRNLKDEMLGKDPPPPPTATTATSAATNGKNANPIKIVKRDSHSLRIKLAVGGLPEKIITSFQLVHDEISNEDNALSKCKAAASVAGKMEKDVEYAYNQGDVQGNIPVLVNELMEKENEVTLCINQLENAETTRAALVSQLKEAVEEQENKLEFIRSQLQVARGQVSQLTTMRQKLTSPTLSTQPKNSHPLSQPVIPFSPPKTTEEDSKKAAAAAVAAKLTASTSSAQMLTSILSSLVAEEAASKSSGLNNPPGFPSMPLFPPKKRQKIDTQAPSNDGTNSEMGSNMNYYGMQMPFPPLPPPPLPTTNSPTNQFVPSSGMMMGVMPYGYVSNALQPPPPPPLPSHIAMGLARPSPLPPLQPPQQPQSQSPQSKNGGGYYRPPGIGFYGQNQAATPPVPRQ